MRQLAWSAAAFLLVAAGVFAVGILGYSVEVPSLYHYALVPAGNNSSIADPPSAVNAFAFTFVSSLLFFGYTAPIALAYEASQFTSLMLSGKMSPVDFLLVIPQLIAVAAGLEFVEGVDSDFNHRGILYGRAWRGAKLLALSLLVLAIMLFIRPMLA